MQICSREPRRGDALKNLTTAPKREKCPLVNPQKNQIPNRQKEKVQENGTETKGERLHREKDGISLKMRRKPSERKNGLQEKHLALRNPGIEKINLAGKTLMERKTRTNHFNQRVTKGNLASRRKVQVESKVSHGLKENVELCISAPPFGLWLRYLPKAAEGSQFIILLLLLQR